MRSHEAPWLWQLLGILFQVVDDERTSNYLVLIACPAALISSYGRERLHADIISLVCAGHNKSIQMLEPGIGLAERAAPSCDLISELDLAGQLQRVFTAPHHLPRFQCLADHAAHRFSLISANSEKLWRSYIGPHVEPRFQGLTTVINRQLLHYHPWQIVLATAIMLLLLIHILDFIKGCTLGVQEKGKLSCERWHALMENVWLLHNSSVEFACCHWSSILCPEVAASCLCLTSECDLA